MGSVHTYPEAFLSDQSKGAASQGIEQSGDCTTMNGLSAVVAVDWVEGRGEGRSGGAFGGGGDLNGRPESGSEGVLWSHGEACWVSCE